MVLWRADVVGGEPQELVAAVAVELLGAAVAVDDATVAGDEQNGIVQFVEDDRRARVANSLRQGGRL